MNELSTIVTNGFTYKNLWEDTFRAKQSEIPYQTHLRTDRRDLPEWSAEMKGFSAVPKDIAAAVVSPKAYAERDFLAAGLRWLRANNPVGLVETDGFEPFWLVTLHKDVFEMSRQNSRFRNADRPVVLVHRDGEQAMRARTGKPYLVRTLVHMDAPDHMKYRRVLMEWFTPAKLKTLEAGIRELARMSIDHMASLDGRCDFARDVAARFPLRVLMMMIGIPAEDEERILTFAQELFGVQDEEFSRNVAATTDPVAEVETMADVFSDIEDYFKRLTDARRRMKTGDLASAIANARIDGKSIPHLEAFSMYTNILTAGHDTTSSAISGALWGLAEYPGEFAKLKRNPSLNESMLDEALRWTNVVGHFMRTASEDVELGGQHVRKGDWLMMNYLSANFDESVFDSPEAFRIDRNASRDISFGGGVHACIGRLLAKMEMRILFEELIPRLESLELAGKPKRSSSFFIGGPKSVPIGYRMTR